MSKQLFADIRWLAEETRNRKLNENRAEYSQTVQEIAVMEAKPIGKPIAVLPEADREKRLVDLVAAVTPSDRIVTCDDIQGFVTNADPTRKPNMQTVRATLYRLVKVGILKKVNHPQADRKVGYCVPGFDAAAIRPLAEWAEEVLRKAATPMQAVAIRVAMTQAGYEMEYEPQAAVRNLGRELSKHLALFKKDASGSRWLPENPAGKASDVPQSTATHDGTP
ncbi:MAG: hypothetical protein AAF664_15875 [Planctomycetota bacterium]